MATSAGDRIAHYEILEEIGKGGMGVVYRARDRRLEREVAIKSLPEELSQDPQRVERLRREAKLLAAVTHSHIGAIYGLERRDDEHYLILELVEGETLGERLRRGPLPVPTALELARQIAEALEAAHERGIYRVPASGGGSPEAITELATGENSHLFPQFLSGGDGVVFTVRAGEGSAPSILGSG